MTSPRAHAIGDVLRAGGFDARVIHPELGIHEVTLETGHHVRVMPPSEGDQRVIFGLARERDYKGDTADLGTTPQQDFQYTRSYPSATGEDAADHLRTFMRDPAVVHAIRNDMNARRLSRPPAAPERPRRRPLEEL